jgi:hypothetical protein
MMQGNVNFTAASAGGIAPKERLEKAGNQRELTLGSVLA